MQINNLKKNLKKFKKIKNIIFSSLIMNYYND